MDLLVISLTDGSIKTFDLDTVSSVQLRHIQTLYRRHTATAAEVVDEAVEVVDEAVEVTAQRLIDEQAAMKIINNLDRYQDRIKVPNRPHCGRCGTEGRRRSQKNAMRCTTCLRWTNRYAAEKLLEFVTEAIE